MGEDASIPLQQPLLGGCEAYVSVQLRAPFEPGVYKSTWRFRTPAGVWFGDTFTCSLQVFAAPGAFPPTQSQPQPQPVPPARAPPPPAVPSRDIASWSSPTMPVPAAPIAGVAEDKIVVGLSKLADMGFFNVERNRALLRQYSGNVSAVINCLMEETDNDWASRRR